MLRSLRVRKPTAEKLIANHKTQKSDLTVMSLAGATIGTIGTGSINDDFRAAALQVAIDEQKLIRREHTRRRSSSTNSFYSEEETCSDYSEGDAYSEEETFSDYSEGETYNGGETFTQAETETVGSQTKDNYTGEGKTKTARSQTQNTVESKQSSPMNRSKKQIASDGSRSVISEDSYQSRYDDIKSYQEKREPEFKNSSSFSSSSYDALCGIIHPVGCFGYDPTRLNHHRSRLQAEHRENIRKLPNSPRSIDDTKSANIRPEVTRSSATGSSATRSSAIGHSSTRFSATRTSATGTCATRSSATRFSAKNSEATIPLGTFRTERHGINQEQLRKCMDESIGSIPVEIGCKARLNRIPISITEKFSCYKQASDQGSEFSNSGHETATLINSSTSVFESNHASAKHYDQFTIENSHQGRSFQSHARDKYAISNENDEIFNDTHKNRREKYALNGITTPKTSFASQKLTAEGTHRVFASIPQEEQGKYGNVYLDELTLVSSLSLEQSHAAGRPIFNHKNFDKQKMALMPKEIRPESPSGLTVDSVSSSEPSRTTQRANNISQHLKRTDDIHNMIDNTHQRSHREFNTIMSRVHSQISPTMQYRGKYETEIRQEYSDDGQRTCLQLRRHKPTLQIPQQVKPSPNTFSREKGNLIMINDKLSDVTVGTQDKFLTAAESWRIQKLAAASPPYKETRKYVQDSRIGQLPVAYNRVQASRRIETHMFLNPRHSPNHVFLKNASSATIMAGQKLEQEKFLRL